MVSRIFAFLVWAACAFGLAFWGLRWLAKPLPVPDFSAAVSMVNAPRSDMTRLLTAPETAASAAEPATDQSALAARIQLIGLMAAPGGQGAGVALLTVDGKPAKAFRVGQMVDGEHVILAITKQGVNIGLPNDANAATAAAVTLPAQALPPAATGTLAPSANSVGTPNMPAASPQAPPGGNNMSGAFGGPGGIPNGAPPLRPRRL